MKQGRNRQSKSEGSERTMVAFKILPAELEQIDKAAKRLRLTRTDYIIRKALGQPTGDESYDERIAKLEQAVARLEEFAFTQ